MKKLFVAFCALAALAACAKEEIVSLDNGETIQFGNAFVENATRAAATDPSYSTTGKGVALSYFNVYGAVNGVNIFNGDRVEKTTDYGVAWNITTNNKQYWIDGASYIFDAVVDANSVTIDTNTGLPTSLNYVVANQKDMLYKRVTTTGKPADGLVAFDFTHLLSKVKFSVENTTTADASNYRFNLTEIKLLNVYPSGDYAVPAGTWTTAAASEYELEDLIVNSGATQYHSKEVLLIPGSAVGVYVKGEIQAKDADTDWTTVSTMEKTFNNVLGTGNTLAANQAYHFAVKLGIGEEIQFTATAMPKWDNDPAGFDVPLQ